MTANGSPLSLAYFSPLPPARSGIADYSRDLLPHLSAHFAITLFTPDPQQVAPTLAQQFPVQALASYPQQRWHFDLALYQMGNNQHHDAIYDMLLHFPGVVVLHDSGLHDFIAHRTAGQGQPAGLLREIGYALGSEQVARLGQIRRHGAAVTSLPFHNRLLDTSLGVIVHSEYVARQIRQQRPHCRVQVIPQLMPPQHGRSRRDELPWPQDVVIFASLGQVTSAKQLPLALRALHNLRQYEPKAHYLIVGEDLTGGELETTIADLDLQSNVHITGHVPALQTFVDWAATADVVINLRHPTIGETSATALRAMAVARPLLVFDHGWYRELPDTACLKVPVQDEAALLAAMTQLARAPAQRMQMGQAGQEFIYKTADPAQVAEACTRFLHETVQRYRRG